MCGGKGLLRDQFHNVIPVVDGQEFFAIESDPDDRLILKKRAERLISRMFSQITIYRIGRDRQVRHK
jgi:hypothetical protein